MSVPVILPCSFVIPDRGFCDPCTVQHDPRADTGAVYHSTGDHRTGVRLSGLIKMDLCPVYGKQSADLRITERGDSEDLFCHFGRFPDHQWHHQLHSDLWTFRIPGNGCPGCGSGDADLPYSGTVDRGLVSGEERREAAVV